MTGQTVAILGAGGHGQDIGDDLGNVVYYDDSPDVEVPSIEAFDGKWPITVIGSPLDATSHRRHIIGINDCRQRKAVADRLADRGINPCASMWVHKGANIGPNVRYGQHTHINAGAFLTRCTLGAYVTVGPNATICGDVTIGNLVSIGAGAVVCEFSTIGDGATIGAGCVLPPHTHVPAGETWVGVPARPVR